MTATTVEEMIPTPPRGRLERLEDLALAVALGLMIALPLVEAVLRRLFQTGISGQTSLVQHLVLIVGMAGGAVSARDGRLLALGTVELLARGRWREQIRAFSGGVAAAITVLLCLAAMRFALSEREAGSVLAYGVRTWVVQLVLPLGFGLIAVRILRLVSPLWRWRLTAAGVAVLLLLLTAFPPLAPARLLAPALVVLLAAALFGAPIFTVLGGAGLIMFWRDASPIASMTVDHYGLVTNPTLPTLPLFTLAGFFLAEGGASKRLIRVFTALVGRVRGGPAILVALVCAFFTTFTGASGVTILALGGLLMPVLLSAGYKERTSLGLLTATGSLGLLFPPCLPLIFYAVVANVDIRDMFLGGLLPGTLLVVLTALWGISQAPREAVAAAQPFDRREALRAMWWAKWELLTPVVALGSIFTGLATPVESAAMTAAYTFVVGAFIHRDMSLRSEVLHAMAEAGLLVGGVLLILGVALGFTNYLAFAEVPSRAADWVTGSIESKWAFLLLLNVALIVVGALMDIYSAIVIVVPLIVPLGRAFGIDPVHLGIIFLANMELGFLMPPVGENIFIASLRFKQPISVVIKSTVPMMLVFLVGVLLITYLPWLSTTLPSLGR